MMSAYSRGANFERRVRRHFESQGWVVFRSAGSHSPADLIALKTGEVMLIQCQITKDFTQQKKDTLIHLGQELYCQVALAWREERTLVVKVLGYVDGRWQYDTEVKG